MDHQFINQHEVIARYRRGELDGAERDAFEVHMLGCNACQRDLEADDALTTGLAALFESHVVRQPVRGAMLRGYWAQALAASVLLVTAGGTLGWFLSGNTGDSSAANPQSQVVFLQRVRDADFLQPVPLRLDPNTAIAVLVLDAVQPELERYNVRILAADGSEVWSARDLPAARSERPADRNLVVLVPTRLLEPARYRIEVTSSVDGREVRSGTFQVDVLRPSSQTPP